MVSTMAEAANGFNNGRSNRNELRSTGHKQEEGTDYTKIRKESAYTFQSGRTAPAAKW